MMTDEMLKAYPVLLAGGSGTRLWPVSREFYPKQLACFFGDGSLIQNTIRRLTPVFDAENIRIVCGQNHGPDIARDMEDIGVPSEGKMIIEPCGRNTAPAILLAAMSILETEPDAVIFIFPADHVIQDVDAFHQKIEQARTLALQEYIVTFGVRPDYAETGYGYIEASETPAGDAFRIQTFKEKPDLETAESYVAAGNFFWNSGMFAFRASVILDEFRRFKPGMVDRMTALIRGAGTDGLEGYADLENISVDYAVMEPTDRGAVLPSTFGWSDIGSWKSLYDFLPKAENGNVVAGGDVLFNNATNSFIMGGERLIAVNNLDHVVVVETPDALFVSDMETSRDVKAIVEQLQHTGRRECREHTDVRAPWGRHKILERTEDGVVRRIVVNPGAEMAVTAPDQNARWLVVRGAGRLQTETAAYDLAEGDAAPPDVAPPFSVKNTGAGPLHIIEAAGSAG